MVYTLQHENKITQASKQNKKKTSVEIITLFVFNFVVIQNTYFILLQRWEIAIKKISLMSVAENKDDKDQRRRQTAAGFFNGEFSFSSSVEDSSSEEDSECFGRKMVIFGRFNGSDPLR